MREPFCDVDGSSRMALARHDRGEELREGRRGMHERLSRVEEDGPESHRADDRSPPQGVDALGERLDEPSLSSTTSASAACSGAGICVADPRPRVGSVHPALHQPGEAHLPGRRAPRRRRRSPGRLRSRSAAASPARRCRRCSDAAPAPPRSRARPPGARWPRARAVSPRRRTRPAAIRARSNPPSASTTSDPNRFDRGVEAGGARRDGLARQPVGIDDDGPALGQHAPPPWTCPTRSRPSGPRSA